MSTEDTENATVNPAKTGANSLSVVPDASDVDPAAIQSERRRRIAIAQDEELKWLNLKTVLRGNSDKLKYRAARDAWKITERFLLTDDNVLYYMNWTPRNQQDNQEELRLRLVVSTTMIQEVLQNNHDSLEGGHQGVVRTYQRVKQDYWFGLYASVEKHVKSCPNCSSSKSKPQLRGYSPGNILAERPFQIVSMDFVIPLPKSRRGNTALLLFQCAFTGFVIAKPMSHTPAFKVAQVFEECIYRRFGAPSLIRHDRDPRFMSEVFQAFAELMRSRSRATLRCRPQANGQQERSVKTVMQSVKVYAEDPLQQDWDEIAEHLVLVFAINNTMDTTRKETPFYLVHGWDASSTMKAITTSLRCGTPKQSEALAWRQEVNRQQEVAWQMAQEYQHTQKSRRMRLPNNALSKMEKASLQNEEAEDSTLQYSEDSATKLKATKKKLFEEGSRAWLYMEIVKPGLTKKLAHRWHGPYRIKKKFDDFAFELKLPDKSGYRFYPVVHI
ncbi:reverse transcriptase [Phytophthora megakarya]|uniref:Reverse transcriptase n=1 Tax=Phytophthora megakarya TaxID=4795 RepID=A0A225UUJ2_9STRA|nr:reverse transcriptase [Phytophthora megakarya]